MSRSYESRDGRMKLLSKIKKSPRVDSRRKDSDTFTGPSEETVNSSITARRMSIGFLGEYEYLREEVFQAQHLFVRAFYKVLNQQLPQIDTNWVSGCKKRHQELFKMFSAIVMQDEEVGLVFVTRSGRPYELDDIKYCAGRFTIKGIDIFDDIIDVYVLDKEPKIYCSLFKAMLHVSFACQQTRTSQPDLFNELKQLAFSLYERGGLYNECNPDAKEWKRQELSTLEILTHQPTRSDDPEIMQAFEHVISDIKQGCLFLKDRRTRNFCKNYVKEFCRALVAAESYMNSPYEDKDYYLSMASDAAIVPELKGLNISSSLLKSAFEGDPLKGCVFDVATGYQSHYNEVKDDKSPLIKTIHITNPGKFKTRAIHLTVSAVQDRCAYLHNRLAFLLERIPSDCTKHQNRGIEFTKKITGPSWREDRFWPSVLAFDWSNATDKLWSWFQEQCLSLVFKPEIVEFWHMVSTCEKTFYFKDGTRRPYTQVNGQPQGLLGSFEAFALAHHIIMLMTMTMSQRENYPASDFYRVLGDDSIICSITTDKKNLVGDTYVKICEWANVPINRTKSTEILSNHRVALVEFAKVYALDGDYFSPIPGRLANRLGKHNQDYYAFSSAFWGQRHGSNNKAWIKKLIEFYYDEEDRPLAQRLMFSGIIPAYAEMGFSDPLLLEEDESYKLALCYWVNKIRSTFAVKMLSDKAKERLSFDNKDLKDSLLELIPEHLDFIFDAIQDSDHKLMAAIQSNLDKEDTIRLLLDCSDDQAILIASTLQLTQDEIDSIRSVMEMLEQISEEPETIGFYKESIKTLKDRLSGLDRLNYRSVYKRDALNSMIFRSSLETYHRIWTPLEA